MKVWQYQEMYNKITQDLDLKDETFVSPDEMSGYINEALSEAENEIIELNKDYFKTKYYLPVVQGSSVYSLPDNIYANKIRSIIYQNGSVIYPIVQYRRRNEFQNLAFTDQYGQADDYRYTLINDSIGQAQIEFHPVSRETAIIPPQAGAFIPVVLYYIRNCTRVPLIGEYCNVEVLAPTQVNTGTSVITVNSGTTNYGVKAQGKVGCTPGSIPYITGDQVMVSAGPGGTLPSPLQPFVTYYVIALTGTTIQLATTLSNALAATPITLTTTGTVFFTIQVACTQAIKNATLIDIPESATFIMQWAKCRCLSKERGNSQLDTESALLIQQKKMMIDTLTTAIQDDDDEITPDFSHYQETS